MVKKFGTRQQVWDEECTMTRGGLSKDDLVLSKAGRIVSKKKSEAARASYQKFGFQKRARGKDEEKEEVEDQHKPKKRRRRKKKKLLDE